MATKDTTIPIQATYQGGQTMPAQGTPGYEVSKTLSENKGGLTTNQINDIFNQKLGRNATDYEVKTYGPASIQTLANVDNEYSKLNPNSISDYLKSQGMDNSLSARQALGTKYGITNIGTAEGNTALLNVLKSGKAPTTTPVTGSVQGATTTAIDSISPATPQTPASTITTQPIVSGSISAAAGQTTPVNDGTINTDPNVVAARNTVQGAMNNYTSAQADVADIDSQIRELRRAQAGNLQGKIKEIEGSGGVVTESSLQEAVRAGNNLYQSRINDLLVQRQQYATAQSQAATALTQARKDQQDAEANFHKSANLSLATTKVQNQQEQFAQKLEQSGYKKVADYVDGTKVGEHFINLNGQNVNVDPSTGAETVIGSGNSVGSSTSSVSGSPVSTTKGNITYTDFASVPDAPTDQNRNVEYPGTAGKTYGAVYEDAVTYAETGKYQKMGQSTKPSTKAYDNAVKSKASNIAGALGMTEDQLRVAYKANSTAIGKLITMKSTVAAFENKAKAQIDMILNGYTDPRTGEKVPSLNTSVSRTDYPIVNSFFVKGKLLAGDTNTQLLSNALITFSTEYAKIMSGSTGSAAASSDSARQEAASLISTALSEGTLDATLGLLQKEMDTTIEGYDKQISSLGSSFVGAKTDIGTSTIPRGSMSASDYVDKVLTSQKIKYDDFMKQVPTGKIPVIQNSDGTIGYVDSQDEITSDYTPI